jgi:uncharacterized protein
VSGAERRRLPMFPLQTVLFPGGRLPLHVFEPRYRVMVRDCLEHDGTFGVVLIARGPEVGGGDERFGVGTTAHIEETTELPDGRRVLVASGRTRIAIGTWLAEVPYPCALVEARPSDGAIDLEALDGTRRAVGRAIALAAELGAPGAVLPAIDESEDPEVLLWRLCDAAPLGTLDRQQLLETDAPNQRAVTLTRLVTEAGDDLLALLSERPAQ